MAGAIIENMSSRKLAILGGILLVCQVCCCIQKYVMRRNVSKKYTVWGQDTSNIQSEKLLSEQYIIPLPYRCCASWWGRYLHQIQTILINFWPHGARSKILLFVQYVASPIMSQSFCYLTIVVMPKCHFKRILMGWAKASMSTRLGLSRGVKTSARYYSSCFRDTQCFLVR